jgi:hypothetical protein
MEKDKEEKLVASASAVDLVTKAFAVPDFIAKGTSVAGSLFSVNELSKGLSLGISDYDFSKGYLQAVTHQTGVLSQLVSAGVTEMITGIGKTNDFLTKMMGPTTGAIADIGLLNTRVSALMGNGAVDQLFGTTRNISSLCLGVLDQQTALMGGITALKQPEWNSPFLDSMRLVDEGISTVIRSFPNYPAEIELPTLEVVREAAEVEPEELSGHQTLLDSYLKKIDPELIEYRQGCWQTFNKREKDYIGQASSSMRRLVDSLFRAIAPDDKVKETNYFKNSPKAKDKNGNPTRRARINYVIKLDDEKSEHLKRLASLADGFLEANDNLSAWDHVPLKKT